MNRISGLLRRRLWDSLGYSLRGLKACYRYEEAFQVEVVLSLVLIPLGLWLGENAVEKVLLVGSVLMVMIIELLNSAIEAAIDRISLEPAELSGRAKDLGSAAVFMSMAMVLLVWGLIVFG